MTAVDRRWRRQRTRLEWSEILSAVIALVHGVQLCLPSQTFSTARSYRVMAQIAPEPVVGAVMIALGCAHVAGMAGLIPLRVRRAAYALAVGVSLCFALTFLLANPAGLLWPSLVVDAAVAAVAFTALREALGRRS